MPTRDGRDDGAGRSQLPVSQLGKAERQRHWAAIRGEGLGSGAGWFWASPPGLDARTPAAAGRLWRRDLDP